MLLKAMRLEHHCINLFMGIDITTTLLTRNLVFTDLSSIPNVSSVNEEPENLEVKSLTPTEPFSPEPEDRQDYSQRESSPEPRPSTFSFPSEDEPVTMISKSIPPSAMSTSTRSPRSRQLGEGTCDNLGLCEVVISSLMQATLIIDTLTAAIWFLQSQVEKKERKISVFLFHLSF